MLAPQPRLEEAPPLAAVAVLGERRVHGDALPRLRRLLHPHQVARAEAVGGQRRDAQPVGGADDAAVGRVRDHREHAAHDQPVEDALVVGERVVQVERLQRPLGGEGDAGRVRLEPDDARVEDDVERLDVARVVPAHVGREAPRRLVGVRAHVEAVRRRRERRAEREQLVEQRRRVLRPRDVRVGDERVPARAQHVRDQLGLEEAHPVEEVRRVAEVRRRQRARVVVRRDPPRVQLQQQRLVEGRHDHLRAEPELDHVVAPVHQHLGDARVAEGEPRVPADRHVLHQHLHRRVRRPLRRQLGRVGPPAQHAVGLQQPAHVVRLALGLRHRRLGVRRLKRLRVARRAVPLDGRANRGDRLLALARHEEGGVRGMRRGSLGRVRGPDALDGRRGGGRADGG